MGVLRILFFLLPSLAVIFLNGCASSAVSRNAASQIDDAFQNSSTSNGRVSETNLANIYQNSSQTSKGVWLGGATGAIAGGLTSGVGIFVGAAEGAIFGGALGAYIDSQTTLMDRIENRGAKVIVLGDQVLIVMPSRTVFNAMTAEINPSAYSTLDALAEMINGYPNMSVKIAAFSNATGPERVNLALTKEQANKVMRYLWRRGVNTRVMYADGYGGSRLVERNSMAWDSGQNYRLEITLERLPV